MIIQICFYESEDVFIEIDNYSSVDANNGGYLIIAPVKSYKIKVFAYSHSDIKAWYIIDE